MNRNILIAMICFAAFASCKNKHAENQTTDTFHAKTINEIFPTPKVKIKSIGIYLYDGYSPLDAMGPYSVFTHLMGTNVFFIARHKGIVEGGAGLKVEVDTSIDEVKHLDILLIPGGLRTTYEQTKDKEFLRWVRSIDSSSKYTVSVCTGAWILGAAGLLKDKEATTHWYGKGILAGYGAKIQNTRYAHSGKYWTGAGVSAGIDLSLALVNEIAGEQYTRATMLDLEYDPQPPFKGGSEKNSDKGMVEGMRAMYDDGMDAALHPGKICKNLPFDKAKDLVCGMPLTAGVVDTAHYHGEVFEFCSKGCKDAFKKNPSAYTSK